MRPPRPLRPVLLLLALPLLHMGLLAARAGADEIVLGGGTRLNGVVLERGPERVRVLLASGGELELAAADVKEIVADADAPKGDKVVRYASGKQVRREGLETALVHYVHPKTGQRVDLVGAVHIADMAYYREVQRLLEAADLVLYELVKDEDADAEAAQEGPNPIRDFQAKMAGWFGFAFQLDGIAYDRPHFVHADMTVAQFQAAAEKSGAKGIVELLGKGKQPREAPGATPPQPPAPPEAPTPPATPTPPSRPPAAPPAAQDGACPPTTGAQPPEAPPTPAPEPAAPVPPETPPETPAPPKAAGALAGIEGQVKMLENMLKAMGIEDEKRGPQVRKTVKGFLGRMLGSMGPQMGMLLGSATNDLLILKRNEVAIERLQEVPESARSVAIFYGAAHLPDLEKRIEALGYERVGARWLLAWDMR